MRSMKMSGTRAAVKPKKETAARLRPVDPLYVIFEQHLFNFADSDSDRKTFITAIVTDYLNYLRKNHIIVPRSLEQAIMEELGTQVNVMLVKKIYGCLSITDYVGAVQPAVCKKAKTRYKKMTSRKELDRKAG